MLFQHEQLKDQELKLKQLWKLEPSEHRLNAVLGKCALKTTFVVVKPCNDNVMHFNQIYFFYEISSCTTGAKLEVSWLNAHCMGRTPRKLRVIL